MHPIILVLASCTYIHLLLTICRTRSSQRRQLDTDWPSYLCLCYNLYLSKMESITFNITALVKCTVYYKSLLRYKTYLISFNGQCYNTVVLRIVLPNTRGKYLLMIWWEILWIVSLKPVKDSVVKWQKGEGKDTDDENYIMVVQNISKRPSIGFFKPPHYSRHIPIRKGHSILLKNTPKSFIGGYIVQWF